eukprot:SAG11_NODE_2807_length_2949_cov_2.248421_1_plen_175_part_00
MHAHFHVVPRTADDGLLKLPPSAKVHYCIPQITLDTAGCTQWVPHEFRTRCLVSHCTARHTPPDLCSALGTSSELRGVGLDRRCSRRKRRRACSPPWHRPRRSSPLAAPRMIALMARPPPPPSLKPDRTVRRIFSMMVHGFSGSIGTTHESTKKKRGHRLFWLFYLTIHSAKLI